MNQIVYLVQNRDTQDASQFLSSLQEVEKYIKKLTSQSQVVKRMNPYQPWVAHSFDEPPMCKNDKEFVSNCMSHLSLNKFTVLYLTLKNKKHQLSISPMVLEPAKTQFKELYPNLDTYQYHEISLIPSKKVKGMYHDVTLKQDYILAYLSNKKDESVFWNIYHDGQEDTIKLLTAKIKDLLNKNQIPKSWFKAGDEDLHLSVDFVLTAKNIKKLDTCIKNHP